MKILLDTNIVIYRESDNSTFNGIGELFKIIDNDVQMQKYINPVIKREILQNVFDMKREILINRLNSYNMLERSSKEICKDVNDKVGYMDKTINDQIDSLILSDIYTNRADLLISQDKKIKSKAVLLGIPNKVVSINEFIYKSKDEKRINHSILDINKVKIGTININDTFFDGLKKSYPGFEEWFEGKKNDDAYCYYDKDKLLALLILKNEEIGEDYSNISPTMKQNRKLKISTFKVDIEHKKIGERFMKIIFDQAIYSGVDEIYVTIYNDDEKKKNLISYLEKFGFKYHGRKNGTELVYIRNMTKHFFKDEPLKSYPYISRENDSFVIPIQPKYHTYLLPDSKLSRESYNNIHMPVEYAIKKYYITSAGFKQKPKIGDNVIFYRTSDGIVPAKYSSVLTTIGIVTDIYVPNTIEELLKKVKNKTVYTDKEIIDKYTPKIKNTYVIEFAYVATLSNKINLTDCLTSGILFEAPRSPEYIEKQQFRKIIEYGNIDSSIVI